MLKNIKTKIVLLTLLLLIVSCADDLGNYNYTAINELKVTGIEKKYTVYNGDHFKITPNLNPTKDDGTDPNRYTYQWIAYDRTKASTEAKTVLAKTKDLDIDVKLAPTEYAIYYFIKDNVTGVTWQQEIFTLTVVSSIYEGWLVLGDVDGKARLDMVSILPNVTEPRIITDVLAKTGSDLKLSGKAVSVNCSKNPISSPLLYGIYVTASESGTSRIDPDSFAWTLSQNIAYEILDNSFPSNFGVDFMKTYNILDENLIYSKGNIYYYNRIQLIRYSLPQNKVDTETKTFYAAPFIAENQLSFGSPVFYDQNGRRFLRYGCVSSTCSKMPDAVGTGAVLDWNNTNSDLVYMTTSNFNGMENFAVLKDITTGKYNLLRFNKGFVQTYYKAILNAPDFDKAKLFAVSPDAGYLFYTVGNKVYEYDSGTQSAKLMLDKGTDEITYIGFHSTAKSFANKLVVGSYGSEDKLELYTVPPVNGDLILTNSYSGLSKIVSVAYRAR